MAEKTFSVSLKLLENYVFQVDFGDAGYILTDEPEPLGQGEGPNPSALLATSVANCLSASLLFALRKFKQSPTELHAEVNGEMERQDGRWRISHLSVALTLGTGDLDPEILDKALAQFEEFCVVTQSVKQGIGVSLQVLDQDGKQLHVG